MRRLIAIFLLLIVDQASASQIDPVISVQHDSQRGVTCWVLNDVAISCLPDSQIQRQSTPAPEQPQGRANPTNTPAPRSHKERLQL